MLPAITAVVGNAVRTKGSTAAGWLPVNGMKPPLCRLTESNALNGEPVPSPYFSYRPHISHPYPDRVSPLSRRSILLGTLAAAGAGVAAACTSSNKSGTAAASAGPPRTTVPPSAAPCRTTAPPSAAHTSSTAIPTGPATEVVNAPRTRQDVALSFHAAGDP